MGREISDKCDRCPAVRGAENKWLLAFTTLNREIRVIPFSEDALNTRESFTFLCGEACAMQYLSEHLPDLHYKAPKPASRDSLEPTKLRVPTGDSIQYYVRDSPEQ